MLQKIKQQLKRFWGWIIAIVVGGVAIANMAGIPPEQPVDNRAKGSDEVVSQGEESLFAEIDSNGNVVRVIVADKDFVNSGAVGEPKNWVRVYYNGGKRKNYPGNGYVYDKDKDLFIPPKPRFDAILNDETGKWNTPTPLPPISPTASI